MGDRRRLLALALTCAALTAAPRASAQWNEEKQEALEKERAKAAEQERERKARDPEDPRVIVARTTAVEIADVGLRGGAVESRDAEAQTGFALAIAGGSYFDGAVNRRVNVEGRVGESDGVEGSIRADLALGYRFDLDPWYGFFVRGGARGRLFGNDRLSVSMLEAPQAQVGFQFLPTVSERGKSSPLGPVTLIEVAGRASAGLVARAEVDTAERHLKPTPAFGGHLGVIVDMVALNVEVSHFLPNGASDEAFDDAVASVCASGRVISICGNGEATWTSVTLRTTGERRERILMYGATMSIALRDLLPGGGW